MEVIVNNESLDLSENPVMSFQVADISQLDERQGDFSYEFDIPATNKNRRLLKRSHTIFGFPYQYIEAWIKTSADVKKGFIQVTEFNGRFKANFFSGNANWIALIGDKLLSDLNLSVWDHTYDEATVKGSFSNTEGYIYPYMQVFSGPEREAFCGLINDTIYSTDGYINWDDISGIFYNQGQYEAPYYTAKEDYTLSVYANIAIGTYAGAATGSIVIRKNDSENLHSIAFPFGGVLQKSFDLKANDKIGIYIIFSGGTSITITNDSFVRFTTGFSDLENISFNDLYPAIYVHSIIKEIFQEINFKLAGPFLNNSDYRHLIMPFAGTTFAQSGEFVVNRSLYLGLTTQITVTTQTIIWDNTTSPYYPGDDWVSPEYVADGDYSIIIECLMSASSQSSSSTDVQILKNGTPLDTETFTGNPYVILYAETTVTAGDDILIKATSTGGDITFSTLSWFKITAQANVGDGDTVKATLIVPEMKQIDLIKFVFISMGIVPVVDDFSKTLTLTEFRAIKQKPAEDWSSKLAGAYNIDFYSFSSNYGKRNWFKYQQGDEQELKDYISRNNSGFGDGRIDLDNVFLSGDTDIYQNEFVPVWFDQFTINDKNAWMAQFIQGRKTQNFIRCSRCADFGLC